MEVYIYPQILGPMFWESRYYREKKNHKGFLRDLIIQLMCKGHVCRTALAIPQSVKTKGQYYIQEKIQDLLFRILLYIHSFNKLTEKISVQEMFKTSQFDREKTTMKYYSSLSIVIKKLTKQSSVQCSSQNIPKIVQTIKKYNIDIAHFLLKGKVNTDSKIQRGVDFKYS